jgi:protein-S-isoprenylcysteine O-methyltransferase Ste14
MDPSIVITVFVLAFVCEYIDSALGMGYGTLLTPGLIIIGFDVHEIIPAILLSQAIAGAPASAFHMLQENLVMEDKRRVLVASSHLFILAAVLITVTVSVSFLIPSPARELYVAILVIVMGVILLAARSRKGSLRSMIFFAAFGVVNKALTGAGLGPVYTTGQIVNGRAPRNAIAMTTLVEVPISLLAFLVYWVFNGSIDLSLAMLLAFGAVMATPFGPMTTRRLTRDTGRVVVGVLSIFIGIVTLVWLLVQPCVEDVIMNPFFWALISMFALMGCTATLTTRRLGQHVFLNVICVAIFGLGRFVVPISCPDQPQFHLGWVQWAIGLPIFALGMVFMFAILYINPWPVVDERHKLVTTGFYSVVRHPMYLGEILWTAGWSIVFGSVLGLALVPVWWGALLFHSVLEEETLERRHGQVYTDYMEKVPGRIVPGLAI